MNKTNENREFDSTNIFMFFVRWWKHLFILGFAAIVLSVVFSSPWFITPKFESTVSMFPSKSHSIGQAVFNPHLDFLDYGTVDDAERLMQVLESGNVRDRVVEKFDLMSHYEISPESPQRNSILRNTYRSNVSSNRTPYGAVVVTVRDKDPQMAADIANAIASIVDTVKNELRQERALMAYQVAKERYDLVVNEITSSEKSLRGVMSMGVEEYESQAEMLTRQLAKDLSANNIAGIRAIEERLEVIRQHGGRFLANKAHLQQTSHSLIGALLSLQSAEADLNNFVSYRMMIDEAYPAERKAYPVRWLIVFLSTFAASFMGVLVLMGYENLKKHGVIASR